MGRLLGQLGRVFVGSPAGGLLGRGLEPWGCGGLRPKAAALPPVGACCLRPHPQDQGRRLRTSWARPGGLACRSRRGAPLLQLRRSVSFFKGKYLFFLHAPSLSLLPPLSPYFPLLSIYPHRKVFCLFLYFLTWCSLWLTQFPFHFTLLEVLLFVGLRKAKAKTWKMLMRFWQQTVKFFLFFPRGCGLSHVFTTQRVALHQAQSILNTYMLLFMVWRLTWWLWGEAGACKKVLYAGTSVEFTQHSS